MGYKGTQRVIRFYRMTLFFLMSEALLSAFSGANSSDSGIRMRLVEKRTSGRDGTIWAYASGSWIFAIVQIVSVLSYSSDNTRHDGPWTFACLSSSTPNSVTLYEMSLSLSGSRIYNDYGESFFSVGVNSSKDLYWDSNRSLNTFTLQSFIFY